MNSTTVNNSNDAFGVFNTIEPKPNLYEHYYCWSEGVKYEDGVLVCIKDNKVVNKEHPTHIVTSVRGSACGNEFEISCMDLKTRELLNIVL